MGQILQILATDSVRIAKEAVAKAKLHSLSETAYDAWVNGALSLVGSLIGALVAVWIAVWSIKKSQKATTSYDEMKNSQTRLDKLRYFGLLVNSVINTSEQNMGHLSTTIAAIENDKVNFSPLTIIPNSDLKRISEDIELESYMLAFANEKSISNGIEEFGTIMNNVDYMYNEFRVLPDLVEKAGVVNVERNQEMKQRFSNIRDIINEIMKNSQGYPADVIQNLYNIYNDIATSGMVTPEILYNKGFVPFNNLMMAVLSVNHNIHFQQIGYLSLQGKELFLQTIAENEAYLKILQTIRNNLNNALKDLRTANQVQKMFPNG